MSKYIFIYSTITAIDCEHKISYCSYMEISQRFEGCISHVTLKKIFFQHIL